jgi:hypothetical protein
MKSPTFIGRVCLEAVCRKSNKQDSKVNFFLKNMDVEGENSFRQFFRCAFYDGRVRVTDRFFLYLPNNRWTNSFTNADTTFHDTEFIDPHESALRVVCRRGSTDVQ